MNLTELLVTATITAVLGAAGLHTWTQAADHAREVAERTETRNEQQAVLLDRLYCHIDRAHLADSDQVCGPIVTVTTK